MQASLHLNRPEHHNIIHILLYLTQNRQWFIENELLYNYGITVNMCQGYIDKQVNSVDGTTNKRIIKSHESNT